MPDILAQKLIKVKQFPGLSVAGKTLHRSPVEKIKYKTYQY